MKRFMSSCLALLIFFSAPIIDCQNESTSSQYVPVMHKFGSWGQWNTPSEKLAFYIGFINGLFIHRGTAGFADFMTCLQNVPYNQAVAMIDKYYKDNPQRWGEAASEEIVTALTVSDGPCPSRNPWK